MINKCSILLAILLNLIFLNKNNAQYTEVGLGLGASTYWGDLNSPSFSSNITNQSGLVIQISLRKVFQNKYGIKAGLSFGSVKGDDANSTLDWQMLRNLSFKSNITEVAVMAEYYFFGFDTEPGNYIFCPYITGGLAGFRFDPSTVYQGNEVRLQPLGTEGQGINGFPDRYGLYSAAFAAGGGAKFIINEYFNIGVEVVGRRTLTDYLDDISTNYVNYDDLNAANGTLAANLGNRMNEFLGQSQPVQLATGSQRGGASVKDYYFMSIVSINMMLHDGKKRYGRGNKVVCPKF